MLLYSKFGPMKLSFWRWFYIISSNLLLDIVLFKFIFFINSLLSSSILYFICRNVFSFVSISDIFFSNFSILASVSIFILSNLPSNISQILIFSYLASRSLFCPISSTWIIFSPNFFNYSSFLSIVSISYSATINDILIECYFNSS